MAEFEDLLMDKWEVFGEVEPFIAAHDGPIDGGDVPPGA